jgi:hypothetical protein
MVAYPYPPSNLTKYSYGYLVEEGDWGNLQIEDWNNQNSLLTRHKLYDGNGDGLIQFGNNGKLDLGTRKGIPDGSKEPSYDFIDIQGIDPRKGLRFLGSADDGQYIYGSAVTRPRGAIEGTTADDVFLGRSGIKDKFFFDGASEIRVFGYGADKIANFGLEDELILTRHIPEASDLDQDSDIALYFSSSVFGPASISITSTDNHVASGITLISTYSANGLDYYVYKPVFEDIVASHTI